MTDLGAAQLLAAYRAGTLSPVEVMEAVLAQAGRREGQLHALCAVDADGARAAARASEARWRAGTAGALDGVPVTLKENIAVPGAAYRLGTAATADDAVADFEAPPAARLREAGAIAWARTTMPDYGMLSSGLSSLYAEPARNPWDVALTPGGSSAGAAAAAAAGYGPLHLGTDIGGSIRLPAGWCGLVGLKPSHGRVPIKPGYAGRVAGPLTRTVADAALMLAVLAQPDARDPTQLPPLQPGTFAPRGLALRGLRLGLQLDAGWGEAVQPEVAAAVTAAARAFEQAGAIVEPLRPFTTREMADGIDRFWRMRSWLDISALAPERRAKVLPYILDWVAPAAGYDGTTVFRGYSQMQALREATHAACEPFDFVLSPVAPMPAYPAHLASPLHDPARPFEHIAFTLPFNMSEQPALAINAGYTSAGLPIGLQITGRRFDDAGVLALGAAWEQLRPAQRPWPA